MAEPAWRWRPWPRRAGEGGPGRVALTRWFAVVGALAIGAFSVAMGGLISGFLQTQLLARDAEVSRDFAQGIANTAQLAAFFRAPVARPDDAVGEFFAHVAAMPDVLRANVYGPDRRVRWSSRPELIGHDPGPNDELDDALRGRVVVNLEDDEDPAPKAEHQGLPGHGVEFVENYLPVYDEHSHELIGVIEVYRQPLALFAAIRSGQRLIWIGSAAGGGFLFAVLVWFVRRTEQALERQQQRLVEAETLAVVGELSAAVAHSIRNPLASIRSSAELYRELHGDADGVQGEIMRDVDRVEQLVRTLLGYAGDSAAAAAAAAAGPASADVALALREAALRHGPALQAGGKRLELDIPEGLGQVGADPMLLEQVLNSLLSNAAEATAAGDGVCLSARRDGSTARIEIADSGSGIAPEHLQDIFRPFFTTKTRGLGMGLPLARRLVLRLGGDLRIEAAQPRGTRVCLSLPLAEPAA